jgi:type III secretion protein R
LLPEDRRHDISDSDFLVIVPAFTVSELKSAFQIGFFAVFTFFSD